ncbi:Uncharacterised protein [Escherichia coli]|nr:Uncharacterised protein [Escherichia coli]
MINLFYVCGHFCVFGHENKAVLFVCVYSPIIANRNSTIICIYDNVFAYVNIFYLKFVDIITEY